MPKVKSTARHTPAPGTNLVFPTKDNIYQHEEDTAEGEKVRCKLCDCVIFARNKVPHEKTMKHLKNTGKLVVGKPVDLEDLADIKNLPRSDVDFQAHVIQSLKELADAVDQLTEMVEEVLCDEEDFIDEEGPEQSETSSVVVKDDTSTAPAKPEEKKQ